MAKIAIDVDTDLVTGTELAEIVDYIEDIEMAVCARLEGFIIRLLTAYEIDIEGLYIQARFLPENYRFFDIDLSYQKYKEYKQIESIQEIFKKVFTDIRINSEDIHRIVYDMGISSNYDIIHKTEGLINEDLRLWVELQ